MCHTEVFSGESSCWPDIASNQSVLSDQPASARRNRGLPGDTATASRVLRLEPSLSRVQTNHKAERLASAEYSSLTDM